MRFLLMLRPNQISTQLRFLSSWIPKEPVWDLYKEYDKETTKDIKIDVKKLEAMSLFTVDEEMVNKLKTSIQMANKMENFVTDTETKPLIYVKELGVTRLRDDENVTEKYQKEDILKNAENVYDDYFVAPPVKQLNE